MPPSISKNPSTVGRLYSVVEKSAQDWITQKKWNLADANSLSRAPLPKTSEAAIERMNQLRDGSGIFIRAIYKPQSESAVLCPKFVPNLLQSSLVPNQNRASASLWVSEADQSPYRLSPYLIFDELQGSQVSLMADRDLLGEKHAEQFGPGYCTSLEEGKTKLAKKIRNAGKDIFLSGPFHVTSQVNESIISYNQSHIIGIGFPYVPSQDTLDTIENASSFAELEDARSGIGSLVAAIQLSDRLREVTERPIADAVIPKGSTMFIPYELPDTTRAAIAEIEIPPDTKATATVALKMSFRPAVAYSLCSYL